MQPSPAGVRTTLELGLALSSEEHRPLALVRQAVRAEDAGFSFAVISDHFHPWTDQQGQSPFVWSTLGGIAEATRTLRVGTGVTCPTMRLHPAIIAQAAATTQSMFEGRFFLGVGAGENLNEHILGDRWPRPSIRLAMLEEAVRVIRHLWEGGLKSFDGEYYEVDRARIYTLPDVLPEIHLAAAGRSAAEMAGRIADGFISTSPEPGLVDKFRSAGGGSKPRTGQMTVCYAKTADEGLTTLMKWWPIMGIGSELDAELPTPRDFESAASTVRPEDLESKAVVGPDPERHLEMLAKYAAAGFTRVYIHQVGPDQEGFVRFYEQYILPKMGSLEVKHSA